MTDHRPWKKGAPQPLILPQPRYDPWRASSPTLADLSSLPRVSPTILIHLTCQACGIGCGPSDVFCGQCGLRLVLAAPQKRR